MFVFFLTKETQSNRFSNNRFNYSPIASWSGCMILQFKTNLVLTNGTRIWCVPYLSANATTLLFYVFGLDAAEAAGCSAQSDLSSHKSSSAAATSRSEMATTGWRRSAAARTVSRHATLFLWLALAAAALTLAQVLIQLFRPTPPAHSLPLSLPHSLCVFSSVWLAIAAIHPIWLVLTSDARSSIWILFHVDGSKWPWCVWLPICLLRHGCSLTFILFLCFRQRNRTRNWRKSPTRSTLTSRSTASLQVCGLPLVFPLYRSIVMLSRL